MLKWHADYDSAADEYNKAGMSRGSFETSGVIIFFLFSAMCYRNAKNLVECKECLLKSAELHKNARQLFHAAKALDQAMLVCKDLNDFNSIRSIAEKACHLYQQHGSPQSGAASLDKAAKILENNYPQEALALFQNALDVSMVIFFFLNSIDTDFNVLHIYDRLKIVVIKQQNMQAKSLEFW